MNKAEYTDYVIHEIRRLYRLAQEGNPDETAKHRTEGLVHAGVLLGVYTKEDIKHRIDTEHLAIFNETVDTRRSRLAKQKALSALKDTDPDAFYNIPAYQRL